MSLQPFAVAPVFGLLASTPAAGFALINGTTTILSWTAPADGKNHRLSVFASAHISSAMARPQSFT